MTYASKLCGHKLGSLDRGDDCLDAESKGGRIYSSPFIDSLLDTTVINNLLAIFSHIQLVAARLAKFHPYKTNGADWDNIVYHKTKRRMVSPDAKDDLFQRLLQDSKGRDLNLSFGEIKAECSAMMNAGTETTTAAMTSTIFLIYINPKVLQKLREEIDATVPENDIPTYSLMPKLPYLQACIEKSLRVRPASSFGLPRIEKGFQLETQELFNSNPGDLPMELSRRCR